MDPKRSDALTGPHSIAYAKKSNIEIEINQVVAAESPDLLKESAPKKHCKWFSNGILPRSYDKPQEISRRYPPNFLLSASWPKHHSTRRINDVTIRKTKSDIGFMAIYDCQLSLKSIRVQDVILSDYLDKISTTLVNSVVPVLGY